MILSYFRSTYSIPILATSVLWVFASRANAIPPAPGPVPGGAEPGADLRLFLDHEKFSYFGEIIGLNESDDRKFRELTLGAYYRLTHALKVGAFYGRAYGLRHDEDWINDGAGNWGWQNSNSRGEDFAIADVTPVGALDFLPGKNWVGEFKTRYLYDFFNGQQSLDLRPSLRYFWLKNDEPFMNFFFQLEGLFPLNYGATTLCEKWIYFGALYHARTGLDVGGFTATEWQTWSSPQAYTNQGGVPYTVTAQTWIIGALAVFQFDI
jgi:hypothetical protein